MRQSFHFRDPRKTPSLKAVLWCCFRSPEDDRPGPTGMEIEAMTRAQGHPSIRPASDVSEIRRWAESFTNGGICPVYFVPPAEYVGKTENGNRVSRFVIYRYSDPRAEVAREKEMMKERNAA